MKLSPKLAHVGQECVGCGKCARSRNYCFRFISASQQMKNAGILDSEKQGMNVIYKIKDERIVALIDVIKENYCNSSAANT